MNAEFRGHDSVHLLDQGRTTRLAKRDAQNLVNCAVALALANAAPSFNDDADANASAVPKAASDGGEPLLRLQRVDQDNPAAVAQFEVWGSNNFYWQRAGQAVVFGVLTAEAVASLLAEIARALPP